jgi:hypothetical protein
MRKRAPKRSVKTKTPKTKLGLPDLGHSKAAVLDDGLRSSESKRGYRHAIDEFIQWYCSRMRLQLLCSSLRSLRSLPLSFGGDSDS